VGLQKTRINLSREAEGKKKKRVGRRKEREQGRERRAANSGEEKRKEQAAYNEDRALISTKVPTVRGKNNRQVRKSKKKKKKMTFLGPKRLYAFHAAI